MFENRAILSRRDVLKFGAAGFGGLVGVSLLSTKSVEAQGPQPTPTISLELTESELMADSALADRIQQAIRGEVGVAKFADLTPEEKLAYGQSFDFQKNSGDVQIMMLTSQSLQTMTSTMLNEITNHVLARSRNDKKTYHCAPLANLLIREIVTALVANQFPAQSSLSNAKTGLKVEIEDVYSGSFYDPKTKKLVSARSYQFTGNVTMRNGEVKKFLFISNPDASSPGTALVKPMNEQIHIAKSARKISGVELKEAQEEVYNRLHGPCNGPNGQSPRTQPQEVPKVNPAAVEYPGSKAVQIPDGDLSWLGPTAGAIALFVSALVAFRNRRQVVQSSV